MAEREEEETPEEEESQSEGREIGDEKRNEERRNSDSSTLPDGDFAGLVLSTTRLQIGAHHTESKQNNYI